MPYYIKYISYLALFLICSCKADQRKSNSGGIDLVKIDTTFLGARLTSFEHLGDNRYEAIISPAFEPVNPSPWFAFGISAQTEKEIEIELNYGKYQHRYIPKISSDGKLWEKLPQTRFSVDTVTGKALLNLWVTPQRQYVAAQELESSRDTYAWIDTTMEYHPNLVRKVAGKTALGNNNYVLELEDPTVRKAVILIARQHPPEIPGGTIGFKAFYEALLAHSSLASKFRKRYNVYAFPLLNPDGADMGNWRHNAKGVDLNRDWQEFTQPETQMVKSYVEDKIEAGQHIDFAIDFHTSHSGPYLLVLDSINASKTKKHTAQWIRNIERNSLFEVEVRRRSQDLPYCYNYFYNQLGCEAVTYEDGDEVERDVIREKAAVYAQELMRTLINN